MRVNEAKFQKMLDIIQNKSLRAFFDGFSSEYSSNGNINYKIEKLAELNSAGLLDFAIKYYLKKYERYGSFNLKNDIMKKELSNVLKNYIGYLRYGKKLATDKELNNLKMDDLDILISLFKKEIE